MKLIRDARTLKGKAMSSLRQGLSAFNSYVEDGRVTTVLLHLQHACEMLLKAALVQRRVSVFDKKSGVSLGFAKCVNLAQSHCGLSPEAAGTMRAIDSMRDAEQHWLVCVDEGLLYIHARALVTVIDEVLRASFRDSLSMHLPSRILPVSTTPPSNVAVLMETEYEQIVELLKPGRRARDEGRARIRTLLAMEAHVVDDVAVSERDIDRIEKAIRANKEFRNVFPRLTALGTRTEGDGLEVKVHFTKNQGAPVRYVAADDPAEAAAVREVDLQKKYHLTPKSLAAAVGLTFPRAAVLRRHLKLDGDPAYHHIFEIGKSKFPCYSDNAVRAMKEALKTIDMAALWAAR